MKKKEYWMLSVQQGPEIKSGIIDMHPAEWVIEQYEKGIFTFAIVHSMEITAEEFTRLTGLYKKANEEFENDSNAGQESNDDNKTKSNIVLPDK